MSMPNFDRDPRHRRKLDAVSARIKIGLDDIKGWPLRTPARAVLGHTSAMVFAAQETIEANGRCHHQVLLLGESQTRLNMMTMTGGDTREERQEAKKAVWTRTAQLFNLLDSDVMVWLQDAWYSDISKEQYATGEWDWPSDSPERREALFLTVVTPTKQATLVCPYARREDGIEWEDFHKADDTQGAFEDAVLGELVQQYRYLAPPSATARDGQRRLSALAARIMSPQRLLNELKEMGQYIAEVDERYLRTN